ncbi:MAG: hypothetical protein HC888_12565 [Candidatus Competibacteraceae bacterium]|nr:hypothetical protein [Candidatus Competibacteraceae bacterium]
MKVTRDGIDHFAQVTAAGFQDTGGGGVAFAGGVKDERGHGLQVVDLDFVAVHGVEEGLQIGLA